MRPTTDYAPAIRHAIEKGIKRLVADVVVAVHQNIAEQIATYVGNGRSVKQLRLGAGVGRARRGIKRDMSCIATGCKNRSKGPRFRYLCEKHLRASARQVEEWRAARKKA